MEVPKSWTFKSSEVAGAFDKHVREQLPWYEQLTDLVATVAKAYLPEGGRAYDVGASTGNIGRALAETIEARGIRWTGIENSEAMRPMYNAPGVLEITDAVTYEYKQCDLVVCFLTLMFFPVDVRVHWLREIHKKIRVGGAIIIVDKEEPAGGVLSSSIHRHVMLSKLKAGTSADDVLKKEFSLDGIQRPIKRGMLSAIGAEEIFRFGDFVAYVLEKKES